MAVAAVVIAGALPSERVLAVGVCSLAIGAVITTVSVHERSVWAFFAGTAVAGIGFSGGLQGSFRSVIPVTEAGDRAGVLSVLWVVSYLGLGLPAVVAGTLVADGQDLLKTAEGYNIAVIVLAGLALGGLVPQGWGRRGS